MRFIPLEDAGVNDETGRFADRIVDWQHRRTTLQAHVEPGLSLFAADCFALLLELQLLDGQVGDVLGDGGGSGDRGKYCQRGQAR